jgi:threonine dehydrogenase-like Zn-dependent dehydrogenase
VLGAHIDGGMRERLVVPEDHLHPSATLSFDELALAETLSIGGHAVTRVDPRAEDAERVLVIGAGPIGLAVATFLGARGIAPVLADVSAGRRDFAASWAGVRTLAPGDDPAAAARGAFDGELPTLVFDATGSAASMAGSFGLGAHGGRLVFVGLVQADITFFDPDLHRRELTLYASRNATATDFDRSVRLLESGTLDLAPWMTDRCTLDDVPAVFPTWADGSRPGQVKGLVSID